MLLKDKKKLLAEALGYNSNENIVNYGISFSKFIKPNIKIADEYIVLVQNASWVTKQWSIANWQNLIKQIEKRGIPILLPSGNLEEQKRAKEICSISNLAQALDPMSLNEIAYIIKNAKFSICSDTGLAHLSALVETPSITLYGPTKTSLIGTYGISQIHLVGDNKDINNIEVSEVLEELERNSNLFV